MNLLKSSSAPTGVPRRATWAALLSGIVLLAACGGGKEEAAGPAAAKVNQQAIGVEQVDFVLQQQRGLRPEQTDAARAQILERLIDQALAVQKAAELKLDRDPRVLQQLEAARREVLARAYADKASAAATPPSAEEVRQYFQDNPALFSERRVYSIQEIAIEAPADQLPALRAKLAEVKNIGEFVDHLKAANLRFAGNQAVRAAEQLPLASLKTFAGMKDGQAVLSATPSGAQVLVLAGSRLQPVTEEQARPAIEKFLLNESKRRLLEEDRKTLRAAASIEYVGTFAEGAASAAAAAAAPQNPASGGLGAVETGPGMAPK